MSCNLSQSMTGKIEVRKNTLKYELHLYKESLVYQFWIGQRQYRLEYTDNMWIFIRSLIISYHSTDYKNHNANLTTTIVSVSDSGFLWSKWRTWLNSSGGMVDDDDNDKAETKWNSKNTNHKNNDNKHNAELQRADPCTKVTG